MANLDHIHFEGDPPLRRATRPRSGLRPAREQGPRQASEPKASGAEPLDPFFVWLLQQVGMAADGYRPTALRRRLPACLRALRATSTARARAILEQQPALLPQAISAILIGVSEFFRDPPVWDYVEARLLPELLRQRGTLRVYSVGCSEGQELYSMAMLLDELGILEGSVLLGVDCRPDAVAWARAGMYDAADIQTVPRDRKERYFRQVGPQFGIVPRLRGHVRWGVADAFGSHGTGAWDILLFRNVAIYMETDRVGLLWERLCGRLAAGGVLVTGKAERPPTTLPLRRLSTCIYQKSDG